MKDVTVNIIFKPEEPINDSSFTFTKNNYTYANWARAQMEAYSKIKKVEDKKVFIDWKIDVIDGEDQNLIYHFDRNSINLKRIYDDISDIDTVLFDNTDYHRLFLLSEILDHFNLVDKVQKSYLDSILFPSWAKGFMNTEGLIGYQNYFCNRGIDFLNENKVIENYEIIEIRKKFILKEKNISSELEQKVLDQFLGDQELCFIKINKNRKKFPNFLETLPTRIYKWFTENATKYYKENF